MSTHGAVPGVPPERPSRAATDVPEEVLERVATGSHWAPHDVLGGHPGPAGVVFRALRPHATAVTVRTADGARLTLDRRGDGPLWTGTLPGVREVPDYRLEVTGPGGTELEDDPYRYLPSLGDVDLHLIGEGRHETLWTALGSHVRHYPDPIAPGGTVSGTSFAVWAPNARAVQVVGDRNEWDGLGASMRTLGSSGVWEIFLPGWAAGDKYKYRILTADGRWVEHADPLARRTEVPPATASIVWESDYVWTDADWLDARAHATVHDRPMSVYEVHLGSWRPGLGYRELAEQLTAYVLDLGYTHVEFMPVAEHPFAGSWGYQVTGYYAPTARFGTPDDFRYLVDTLHRAGIGVLVDWVPAHFPRDAWALARFDGGPLYEYADPRKGEHPDWGTLVFDFGRNEVRNFLVANAVYWLTEFHVDGLRVDAVASMLYLDYSREPGQWVPNVHGGRENLEAIALLQEVNATAYRRAPGIVMIAEESTAWPGVTKPTDAGGLGFGLKWNMGWMHDSLEYMHEEPVNRRWHHGTMTFSMIYAYTENFVLPISHDEVVHGKGSLLYKMPGDRWQQLANVRAYLAFMWAHPGKQLLFMGQEFAQGDEWSADDGLEWWLLEYADHQGVQRLVRDLNRIYRDAPELWTHDTDPSGFEWIDSSDADDDVLSFVRLDGAGHRLVCVVNFAGTPHEGFRVGFPEGGTWREVLNTDAEVYGGSGVGNAGEILAEDVAWNGRAHSARLRLPPLGAVWFRRP